MIRYLVQYFRDLRKREKKVRSFFISFYIIGLAGLIIPFSSAVFLKITPLALILSFAALMFFHTEKFTAKLIVLFTGIFLASYIIEVIGVHTGLIFGIYNYGSGLGLKLLDTPLLIGLNWLKLVYLSSGVIQSLRLPFLPSVILSSLVMLGYDLIMEQVAPYLDLWTWKGDTVPLQNYLAWFILALIFHIILRSFRINTTNVLNAVLLICQVLFFIFLYIFFRLVP